MDRHNTKKKYHTGARRPETPDPSMALKAPPQKFIGGSSELCPVL